jgi:hypothetical protein
MFLTSVSFQHSLSLLDGLIIYRSIHPNIVEELQFEHVRQRRRRSNCGLLLNFRTGLNLYDLFDGSRKFLAVLWYTPRRANCPVWGTLLP